MPLLTLEHRHRAYRADFVIYGFAVLALGLTLVLQHPPGSTGVLEH